MRIKKLIVEVDDKGEAFRLVDFIEDQRACTVEYDFCVGAMHIQPFEACQASGDNWNSFIRQLVEFIS